MNLNILEKILPPKNTVFYDCFERAAKNCNELATLLNEVITEGVVSDDSIIKARTLKHRGTGLENEVLSLLN